MQRPCGKKKISMLVQEWQMRKLALGGGAQMGDRFGMKHQEPTPGEPWPSKLSVTGAHDTLEND